MVSQQNADIANTLQPFFLVFNGLYNFGCMIASDTLFDSWGEFSR